MIVGLANALEFARDELRGLFPRDSHERIGLAAFAAFAACAVALFKPALANHRMADAGVVVGLLGKGLQPERRREVALEGL